MRWRPRHVWRSASDHLFDGLADGDWPVHRPGTPVPSVPDWAVAPVLWLEAQPEEAAGSDPIVPTTVGITIGDIAGRVAEEMGAQFTQGLHSIDVPVFVDIYGANRSVSLSLASDILDILDGALWAPSNFIPLYDYSEDPRALVVEEAIEVNQVRSIWPQAADATTVAWKRAWRVVSFTATCYFQG